MKNKNFICLALVVLLCVSMGAFFTPEAAATVVPLGSITIDDTNFQRCYDWDYEATCIGYPSEDKADIAYLTASIPPGALDLNGQIFQARLYKVLRVGDTYRVISNSIDVPDPSSPFGPYEPGILRESGAVWVNSQAFQYNAYSGNTINFQYSLAFSSLTYGYDVWPNYWSTQDFIDQWSGHIWGNGDGYSTPFEISFAIEWYQVTGYDPPVFTLLGSTEALPTSYDQHGFSCKTTHSEDGWECWTWMLPDDEIHFACSTPWTETYGSASISNPYEAQYRTPDGSYVTFLASSPGSLARACYWIGGSTTGTIYIYGDSMYNPFSRFLVYASNDNSNWQLASEQLVYNTGDRWIDCGTPSGSYEFVMVIAYDSLTNSYMKINCINCGGHY